MPFDLLDGFRLGNFEIEPALGFVARPDGERSVRPEVMEMLVLLARQPRELVSWAVLRQEVGTPQGASDDRFDDLVQELLAALGADSGRKQLVQKLPDGLRLTVKARPLDGDSLGIRPGNFLSELKRRDVIRVSIAYWALAWAILQSVDFVIGVIPEIPPWTLKFLIVLAVIGFPVAIAYAWIYRWTPAGLEVDKGGGPEPSPVSRRRVDYVIVVAALLAVALFAVGPPPDPTGSSNEARTTSIAVLRFVNIGDDPENLIYSDGISDELINLFVQFDELRVPARESSWSLFERNLDIPAMASVLDVDNIIEGSVRRNGDQIRVLIQLIDASGNHIWSKAYERNRNAILDLPSNIAAEVVDELQVVLSLDSSDRLGRRPTHVESAYIFYLRAREYLDRPRQEDNLNAAEALFDKAIEEDPRFALAYAGLCEVHLARFGRERAARDFGAAEAACHRAATLDATIAEIHTALGSLYRQSGQFEKSEDEFRRAIEIRPRFEAAHYGLARSLRGQGRLDEAERILRYCIELEPAYWGTHLALGNFMHRQGRYREAIGPYTRVTELTPNNPDGFTNLGVAYFDAGDWEEAESAYQQALQLEPTSFVYINLGTLYYYRADYEKSVQMHGNAVEVAPDNFRTWGKLAAAARYVDGMEDESRSAYLKAISLAENALEIDPTDSTALAYLASYYVNVGEYEAATTAINSALELESDDPEIQYLHAIVSMALGDEEATLAALENAVSKGYSKRLIMFDPQFELVKGDERFQLLSAPN